MEVKLAFGFVLILPFCFPYSTTSAGCVQCLLNWVCLCVNCKDVVEASSIKSDLSYKFNLHSHQTTTTITVNIIYQPTTIIQSIMFYNCPKFHDKNEYLHIYQRYIRSSIISQPQRHSFIKSMDCLFAFSEWVAINTHHHHQCDSPTSPLPSHHLWSIGLI